MARALWSGAISFGLVNVPVKLYKATASGSGRSISFHQIHSECGTRIQHVRRCPHCEKDVPWEEVAKGYEFAKGRYAVMKEEDFASLPKEDKAAISIEDFVVEDEIDPMFYDTSYYLAPDGPPRAYALLHHALQSTGKVAIAHVMLRTKTHLAVVRAGADRLVLETMYFADEVVDPADIPGVPEHAKAPPREAEMAEKLIAAMTTEFDLSKYQDTYTEAVRAVIEQKIAGAEVTEEPILPEQPAGVIDLMEALRRSVASAAEGGKKKDVPVGDEPAPRHRAAAHAAKKPAHKTAAAKEKTASHTRRPHKKAG